MTTDCASMEWGNESACTHAFNTFGWINLISIETVDMEDGNQTPPGNRQLKVMFFTILTS